jgi:CRISPR type III-B/RAMP module-associated protein Cmr5
MQTFDPKKDAIEIYNEVYEKFLKNIISTPNPEKTETSLRSRAREIPSLMQDTGLLGVLSFCFSKSEYYNDFISCLKGEKVKKDLTKSTEVGYSIYLYLILKGIERTNFIDIKINDPYNTIVDMRKDLSKVRTVERILIPYLSEIKNLCEGTLRSGR